LQCKFTDETHTGTSPGQIANSSIAGDCISGRGGGNGALRCSRHLPQQHARIYDENKLAKGLGELDQFCIARNVHEGCACREGNGSH
jgi:hypothetical protein